MLVSNLLWQCYHLLSESTLHCLKKQDHGCVTFNQVATVTSKTNSKLFPVTISLDQHVSMALPWLLTFPQFTCNSLTFPALSGWSPWTETTHPWLACPWHTGRCCVETGCGVGTESDQHRRQGWWTAQSPGVLSHYDRRKQQHKHKDSPETAPSPNASLSMTDKNIIVM